MDRSYGFCTVPSAGGLGPTRAGSREEQRNLVDWIGAEPLTADSFHSIPFQQAAAHCTYKQAVNKSGLPRSGNPMHLRYVNGETSTALPTAVACILHWYTHLLLYCLVSALLCLDRNAKQIEWPA